MMIYSPNPPPPNIQTVLDSMGCSRDVTWNLMFLTMPVEARYMFTENPVRKFVPTACWRTVHCDYTTGQFLNPFDAGYEQGSAPRRSIKHLLSGPPDHFVAWASNSPIVAHLPLSELLPAPVWVATAQSRLELCAHREVESEPTDMQQAQELLAKFTIK